VRIAPGSPDPLVAEYLQAKAAVDQAQRRLDELTELLVEKMRAEQRKSFSWTGDGYDHRLTFVQKSTPLIDEPGLRKALTAKVFDRFTVRKLDRKRLEEAMGQGTIDPVTVAKFVTMKPSRPYLTYSEKEVPA
jgi:hypothetical protein